MSDAGKTFTKAAADKPDQEPVSADEIAILREMAENLTFALSLIEASDRRQLREALLRALHEVERMIGRHVSAEVH